MNLWFRLLWCLMSARFRASIALPHEASRLRFRVWPLDLDPSFHMNNGRYLTVMDLGRLDIMLQTGLWRAVLENGWVPIASAITIRFRRELRLWQRFRLETRVVCWDATHVIMEQAFVIEGGSRDGHIAAHALFKGGLYDRKSRAFVPVAELMATIGVKAESPTPSPEAAAFLAADAELRQAVRSA